MLNKPNKENRGRAQRPFTLPDNYFEEFHEKLMKQLPAKEVVHSGEYLKIKRLTYWMRAAVVALTLTAAATAAHLFVDDHEASKISEAERNEIIETIFDSYLIDEYNIYCYLTSADANY
jgi:hypothetical protein